MIRFTRASLLEIDEAFLYYEDQLEGLGFEFIEELERATARIEQFPLAWSRFSNNARKCILNRFPYSVIYSYDSSAIIILAVAHTHRKPGYWNARKRKK